MADFTVRYSDFKGGDYGIRDAAKADADTYSGINVYPYSSGLLGVRAGIKQLAVTGLPTHPIVPGPLGFWSSPNGLMVYLGRPYQVPYAGGAATAWNTLPAAANSPLRFIAADNVTYVLSNGILYKYVSPSSVTAITTPSPLSHIVRWGYYFVGIDRNVPWRIWFSTVDAAGAHFDQWGANDYLDIGNQEPVTSLNPIFNTLYVGKRTGWNAVSGVLGTLASIRGVALGLGPVDPRLTTITTDNRVLYWPVEPRPAWFNGERVFIDSEQDVKVRSTPFPCDTVIVTPTARRLVLANDTPGGTEVRSWANRAWSRHFFPAKLAGLVPANIIDGSNLPPDVIYAVLAPVTIGDPVVIGTYNHQLDRPGRVADTYAAPNDMATIHPVAGSVSFPSYWEPIGRQIQVRGVIVQFRKWNCGMADERNQIQLRLDAHGAYGRGQTTGTVATWDEPCSRSSSDGTDDSWRAGVGEQGWGNGFQLHFPNLVGVALREVIVLCNVRTERA